MGILDRMKDVTSEVTKKTAEAATAALGKANELLDEYKKAVAVLEKFGFTVSRFSFGMGITGPNITTAVIGSIDAVQEDGLKRVIEEHGGKGLLCTMLNTLLTAKVLCDQLELKQRAVTLHVTLGIPPAVTAEFGSA